MARTLPPTVSAAATPAASGSSSSGSTTREAYEVPTYTLGTVSNAFPHYAWPACRSACVGDGIGIEFDMDERRQPVAYRPIRGIVYDTHDGKRLTARLDSSSIGPLISWWNQLRWTCTSQSVQEIAQRRRSKVTFIELVIDFFLSTGSLPANRQHPLAIQAKALAKALRQIAGDFGLLVDFKRCSFKEAFNPGKVNSLQPLLAASSLEGICRRPFWDNEQAKHIAVHALAAVQSDLRLWGPAAAAQRDIGSTHELRAGYHKPVLKVDHVKATWDAILAMSFSISATPRATLADPTCGPCIYGHTSTARHGGRAPWWHRASSDDGDSVQVGSTLCHACYLALRKRARDLACGPASTARPPSSSTISPVS